jgi:hypothetical protein
VTFGIFELNGRILRTDPDDSAAKVDALDWVSGSWVRIPNSSAIVVASLDARRLSEAEVAALGVDAAAPGRS